MRRGARLLALLAIAVVAGLACQAALGYWSGVGEDGDGDGIAGAVTVNQGATPTTKESGATNVIVDWGAASLSNGTPVTGYIIKRYNQATGVVATIGSGCGGTITALTCTEAELPAGDWEYTVTPDLRRPLARGRERQERRGQHRTRRDDPLPQPVRRHGRTAAGRRHRDRFRFRTQRSNQLLAQRRRAADVVAEPRRSRRHRLLLGDDPGRHRRRAPFADRRQQLHRRQRRHPRRQHRAELQNRDRTRTECRRLEQHLASRGRGHGRRRQRLRGRLRQIHHRRQRSRRRRRRLSTRPWGRSK